MTIAALTVIFAFFAAHINLKTVFEELLPTKHPYIKVNEKFKKTFGGSNIVNIMVTAEKGDIFNRDFLSKVQQITNELQFVKGVNPFQVISLSTKKLRDVRASTQGIISVPLMWPDLPSDQEGMGKLRDAILGNEMVYGRYVSGDMKSTLITVDFYDHLLNYDVAFKQVMAIVDKAKGKGINIGVVGEPILYGWVGYYVPETLIILAVCTMFLILLLFLVARTWRGTLLPLLAGVVSCIWALGAAKLLGFQMDPLVIVVAFLITARAISHSVQLVTHFDDQIGEGAPDTQAAAMASLAALFKPGMLGVIADAGCMLGVLLTPIPLLHKVAIIGTIWVLTIAISAVLTTPLLLSWARMPKGYAHPVNVFAFLGWVITLAVHLATTRARYYVVAAAAVIFVLSGLYAFNLKVGDTRPGSPILRADSEYNKAATSINKQFQGTDRMFVVIASKEYDAMRKPQNLDYMDYFQNFMESQPEVGGSLSLADALPKIRVSVREGNPRYKEYGADIAENSELIYIYLAGTEPGDIDRFVDAQFQNAAVTLMVKDHKGDTIRSTVARVKEFAAKHPIPGAEYLLAGGLVGVLAAVNEVILAGQIEAIAVGLLVVVICCTVAYRSSTAGMFFMVPVVLSNTLTFSYMTWEGIGMSINTLPVVALGIGLGVDYAFYIIDGIHEEMTKHGDMDLAIAKALSSQGKGVLVTAATLIISVFWWCMSSIRFQAEMGVLMAVWLSISAACALFVMPAMAAVFRPAFIVGKGNK
ncbi:MAG: efflux RND transporter permease subunit [Geobacteraceae bacterium]